MKVRQGFVSNSSTSSFLCGICGNIESERDLGLDDAGMAQCQHNHTFCTEHSKFDWDKDRTIAEKKALLLDDEHYSAIIATALKENQDVDIEDLYEEWKSEARCEVPAALCPLCQLEEVPDDLLLKHLFKEVGFTREEIIQQLKEEYGTCDKLKKDLEG